MDAMDDSVGPELPVIDRPKVMTIPGGPFQARAVARQFVQGELAAFRSEKAGQVRWMHVVVRRPFLHRRRILRDAEAQEPRFVPDFDRLDERSGREDALSHGPSTVTENFGALRIRDAQPEDHREVFAVWLQE